MLHHDGGGVAHLKRDLPGVLDHLHPVGTERMRRVGDELGVAFAILPGARASSNMRARFARTLCPVCRFFSDYRRLESVLLFSVRRRRAPSVVPPSELRFVSAAARSWPQSSFVALRPDDALSKTH